MDNIYNLLKKGNKMIIVGITGCIGCGKTYLANIIESIGYKVYNPDNWTREFYKKRKFLDIIKQNFPMVFNDNIFNKRALRQLVFNDNKQLKKLENIIHPYLRQRLRKIIHQKAKNDDILFLDVALLLEFGWDKYCDYIIVADAADDVQCARVMKRDGISAADFAKIIAVQMPKKEKQMYADWVINTEQPQNILKVQLIKFIKEILE